MARKLAAGNWKMNGLRSALAEAKTLADMFPAPSVDILLCPPATLLSGMAEMLSGTSVEVGGQDCHTAASGAHTGDISAAMLADAGAGYVILGHSERRADHGETDHLVSLKTTAALAAGLVPIVCVGETFAQREAGETLGIIRAQLSGSLPEDCDPARLVIAYEPVWAIGSGKTPTLAQIAEVHDDMRATLSARFGDAAADIPLLYGGSVKPGNAMEIFDTSNVDGALVGGASLKAADFSGIVKALEEA
ncbi:triose-phosphate isomerase [Celeribacter indicus]|uniref:Triosephosphate isomerase n=1 Tax=Celeribacter indicus TaxID=1208324 RepID=A0A0B5E3I9_9RHOB|nr:triose-phosphate isomerase [Celeribacter indicus]AJE47641.1 triosephosphate isomerase [Celeribacter indicus]SDW12882.1 triosephosphate isomerase [Celeribacter indicus]